MNQDAVFVKTAKGIEEVQKRSYSLKPPLRTLLIMVDGRTKAAAILKQTLPLGITPEQVDQLCTEGFIENAAVTTAPQLDLPDSVPIAADALSSERYSSAKQFMNDTMVDAAGLKSFMFTMKIERSDTMDSLRNLLPEYTRLIEKSASAYEAAVLIKRAKELLA